MLDVKNFRHPEHQQVSFEEKTTWLNGIVTVIVPGFYFANMLARLRNTPASEIDYVGPMLTAIGISIGLYIAGAIAAAISSPNDADKSDERDRDINRFGEYVAYYVFGIIVTGALILTIIEADYFWIANAILLAFVLASLTSATLKLIAYRRGF